MVYTFYCNKCDKKIEVEIPISKYSEEKENQVCAECGEKLERVIDQIAGTIYGCGGFYDTNQGVTAR